MGDKSSGEGPPPPSPLTGAYLLVVLPQTHQLQHKDYVIHNLTKGLLTWDKTDCHVDLEKELQTITAQAPEGEEAKNGERLIQFASENLVTEVLIHPQLNTLVQCMRNLLSSFTRHRHIIHAGYTCAGNGSWMLQDGTYSYADFAEMYQEHEVQRVLRAYENTVTVDVHCLQEGDWNNLKGKDPFSKVSRVRLNPKDCVTSTPAIKGFLDFLSPYVTNGSIDELLESSDVVGNIRFSHPTLYVFPGGQGDAALFGINGFNMLVDGGFARKACFWDFSRHLDRLDAVLMTRLNNGNIQGMTSLLQRKRMDHVYPQIGHFFCNMQERRHPLSPDGDKDKDPLLVSLFDQGQDILGSLRHLQLKPQPCYRDPALEPVNLYHKVGHGKLDMYVISPAKDSREVREFMAKWTTQDSKIFCSFTKRGGEFNFPLCNKVSICALLVWQPANPEDNITRLLFPGSTPQHKIFEGLDKLKNLEFMKHAVCSARTLSPSSSSVGLNVRTVSKPKVPASVDKIIENDEKKIEAVKQPIVKPPTGQTEKQPPKSQPPSRPPSKQKPAEKPKEKPKTEVEVKTEKTETAKTEKAKPEKIEKTEAVQKIDKPKEKPKRPISKQPEKKKPTGGEKKDSLKSSPTTPKKIAENKALETKPRASSRTKPSPSATPAKSAKEANNRKVFEQKKEATKRIPPPKKEETKKSERSTAPRKFVPSPSKTDKQQVSPVKAPRPVIKPKQDAKKITKAEKDVVTESVASTPSTVDVELTKAKEDLAEKETKVEKTTVADAAEPAEQPSLSKDEEDEILVIEKIEIGGDGKDKPEESIAVHIRNSREDIIADEETAKDENNVDFPSDEKKEIMKTSDITIPDTDSKQFSEDVQDITKDAPDTSKSRVEFMTTEETSITKEPATDKLTPREKDGKEKSTDIGDIKQTDESHPDEKFSTTVESGATTAPTLPEDERIPLDEIKEGIEEKHIKEETKEKDIGVTHRPEQPTSLPEVPVISSTPFDQRVQLLKDIVKTPDEVADLPVHEEADGGIFAVDETQLARDLQKSRDDLLDIPAPKKAAERKEDAAEEVKLVKDENEKEDATKDLKEDGKAAPCSIPPVELIDQLKADTDETPKPNYIERGPEKEEVDLIDNDGGKSSAIPASLEDDEILDEDKDKETEKEKLLAKESRDLDKDEDVGDKANKEMINEKQVAKSVVEEEIKGEKPVPEDDSPEEDKPQSVQVSDKQTPIKLLDSNNDEQSILPSLVDDKDGRCQITSDQVGEIIKPEDDTKLDKKSESPSAELLATTAISSETGDKASKSPTPEPKAAEGEDAEGIAKVSKSPSPELKLEETKDIEAPVKASKSPSPELKAVEAKDVEALVKASKSPSPEPNIGEAKDAEASVKASTPPLPDPKASEAKDVEAIVKASKSPSPEPDIGKAIDAKASVEASKSPSPDPEAGEVKDVEGIAKASKSPSPEPTLEKAKAAEASVKASKTPSPDPKAGEVEDAEGIAKASKSPSPEPNVGEAEDIEAACKTSKAPSPELKGGEAKDVEGSAKASKTPSPEPTVGETEKVEAAFKGSKAPSPEPKVGKAEDVEAPKSPSPSPEPKHEEVIDLEAAVEASKSLLSEPNTGETKAVEDIVKSLKSPSPEPKLEEAKDIEAADKVSKSPSPEPKAGEAKDGETVVKASKSPSPEPDIGEAKGSEASVKASKSPSPEPKAGEAKDVETIVKASKSPSPEPDIGEAKGAEASVKASKSPSPEPKAGEARDVETIVKASKSPSPEPNIGEPIDGKASVKASKSPSPEPKGGEAKDAEAIIKVSNSPSPEPNIGKAKDGEASVKASKSPSPEPKAGEAKDVEVIVKASKSPSPEPELEEAKDVEASLKASKSPSPEPTAGEAKDVESIVKASKSPSPEPMLEKAEAVKASVGASESPSPEPKAGEAKDVEAIAKAPKSPSPEPKLEEVKDVEAAVKAVKPMVEKDEDIEAVTKAPGSPSPVSKADETAKSPKSQVEEAKVIEAIIKTSKSPSPENPKDTELVVKASTSPEPKAEEAKNIEVVVEASKSTEPMAEKAKEIEAMTKASKSPSPELKIDQSKDIDALTKSPKPTSPELDAEETKNVDALITSSKSPSPEHKAEDICVTSSLSRSLDAKANGIEVIGGASKSGPEDEGTRGTGSPATLSKSPEPKPGQPKSLEALAKSSKSPEPRAEEAKDASSTSSKSPSPEPNICEAKDDETSESLGKRSSLPPSPGMKTEDIENADAQVKVSKSPSPEPKVESVDKDKETDKISKSPATEPVVEQVKELSVMSPSADAKIGGTQAEGPELSKSPSPEPKQHELRAQEPVTKLSKSPEPRKGEMEIGAKSSISPSPEQKTEDSKPKETSPQLSKAPTPEPSTKELTAVKPNEVIATSPSPEPKPKLHSLSPEPAGAKSLTSENQVSKSPSPEPKTELAKGLEPSTKVSMSPSPEPDVEQPEELQADVSMSPALEAQQSSPAPKIAQFDEPLTKISKSPSPESLTEMAKSPEPLTKASKSPSPEPDTDVEAADQKARTPSPEVLGDVNKSPEILTEASKTPEPITKSPEPPAGVSKSPELQSDVAKDSIKTCVSKVVDSKLIEPTTKSPESPSPKPQEPSESLELQTQQSKSPSPEHSADTPKSSNQPNDTISKSSTPEPQGDVAKTQEASVKTSFMLDSQPDESKSPSPEPQAKDSQSPSPSLPISVDEKSSELAGRADDILSEHKKDASGKKLKTKEELNQELMEEKEVDEVTEPEKKDQKNLLAKLDREPTPESKSGSLADSKAESEKLESEKHAKETNLEDNFGAKHDASVEKEQVSGSSKAKEGTESLVAPLEKQVMDEKEIDQSSMKKFEEFKETEDMKPWAKPSVESKLVSGDLSTSIFKMDERVPSISLREASIEQTSEEPAPPQLAEVDKAPCDLESDITPTSLDRKLSSGEVSTKSTDGDEKSVSEKDIKLSGSGSIALEKPGEALPKVDVVEQVISRVESSVHDTTFTKQEDEDELNQQETKEDEIEKLEKSIAGDRAKLRKLIEDNEEAKGSAKIELDRLESISIAQAKEEENISQSSKNDTKLEKSEKGDSLPESMKLEAEKDSVEVRSKDDLKDEALVLDLDQPKKHETVYTTVCSIEKKPDETSENNLGEAVLKPSLVETSIVPEAKLADGVSQNIDDQKESVDDTIGKTMESTPPESSKQKLQEDALQSSLIGSESTTNYPSSKDLDAQLESASLEMPDTGKHEEKKGPVEEEAKSDKRKETPGESVSDKEKTRAVDEELETQDGDHGAEKLSSKSPSPPTVLDMGTKEDGKISPEVKAEDKLSKNIDDETVHPTKSVDAPSVEVDASIKSKELVSPGKSPSMDKKTVSQAKEDKELESTSSTPVPPTSESSNGTTAVPTDVEVEDSKVEAVIVGEESEITNEFETEASPFKQISIESDKVTGIESENSQTSSSFLTGQATEAVKDTLQEKNKEPRGTSGSTEEVKSELSGGDHSTSSNALSFESTKAVDEKDIEGDASLKKSSHEKTISMTEILEEIKETTKPIITKEEKSVKDISSEPSDITSKDVTGSAAAVTDQLHFAESTVDSKHSLESIEPLVIEKSKTVTVIAKSITEKDAGEITTATVTKTEGPSPATKSLVDENLVVKSSTESLGSAKDSTVHSAGVDLSLLSNGKRTSDIAHETYEEVAKDTAVKEHDAKKSDIRVTDILDTAERIVSSLNGKKTIADETNDYIPSFSETKSYSLTIEGKKGPSDEITVETKTIEEGEDAHTEILTGNDRAPSTVIKPADVSVEGADRKSTEKYESIITSSGDMNGHSMLNKEDEPKIDTTSGEIMLNSKESDVALSSASKSETQSAEKTVESVSKSVPAKQDSASRTDDPPETEKLKESSENVGQSVTKVISEVATTISETVSAVHSLLPSDLLKSSTSSANGSITDSPDLSRKSDDPISTAQQDRVKEMSDSKLDLTSKESLIGVTSSFLSMESGVSPGSEKSVDISGSLSKSCEKVTETTDKKSSLSSTQVEPPTEKDQLLLHSTTAALRTTKEFSRSETPASDILSDRDIEIGHCTPYSDTSSGQVSRAVTHVWEMVEGRPESRHYDSDEDIPGSPMSISSHVPSPPQFEYDMSRPQDPMMMSSFYGSLPGDFEEGVKTLSGELASAYDYGIHDKGDISLKKELGGDKLSASIRSSLTSTPESSPLPERRFESLLATSSNEPSTAQAAVPPPAQPSSVLPSSSSLPPKPDPIGKWDKPLGLPPPHSTDSSTPYLRWNPYKEWGKPLGLPSPAPPPPREDTDVEVDTSGSARTTPKKVSKMNAENNKYSSNAVKEASNKSKRSESPVKKATGKDSRKSGPTPVYMDLSYVPHHGNSNYATVEFFKRVRARYYVFSGTEPSKEVFNALLEAKQSWEDKDLEVTIIPTYDTDTLGYWIAENEETLSKLKIDLSPSASRCTINLQDHDTSCSAYRLEF